MNNTNQRQHSINNFTTPPATPDNQKSYRDKKGLKFFGQLRTKCISLIISKISLFKLSETMSEHVRTCPKRKPCSDNFGQKWTAFRFLLDSNNTEYQIVNPLVRLVRTVRTHSTVTRARVLHQKIRFQW